MPTSRRRAAYGQSSVALIVAKCRTGEDRIMSGRRPLSRILVVDDEPHARVAMARLIKLDFGHAVVREAGDAQTALRMIAAERWDLVVLDLSMPGMSGLEALREMRSRQELVPVVIVSGLPAALYEEAAVAAGAFAYLQKERLAKDLHAIVRSFVPELRMAELR
jgi:two-component system invasion response regulator UvrY